MSEQQEYDIEFYKGKLEEKENQISSMLTSIKLNQFKTNKQINTAKLNLQNKKMELKEEKSKTQKLNKKLVELEESRRILEKNIKSLTQEKKNKQKQNQSIIAQYRTLKEEVQKYQRILPRQNFIDQLNIDLSTIMTYQELYYDLHQKSRDYQNLLEKMDIMKQYVEETINEKQKIVEQIKIKKLEIEIKFKQNAQKLNELQTILEEKIKKQEELTKKVYQLEEQISQLKEREQQLNYKIQQYQQKVEQLDSKLSIQINSKEEELRQLSRTQYEKYFNQMKILQQKNSDLQENFLMNLQNIQEKLNQKYEQAMNEKEKSDQVAEILREELRMIKQQKLNLQTEKLQLQNQVQQSEKQKISLSQKIQQITQLKQSKQHQYLELTKVNQSLNNKLQSLQQKFNQAISQKEQKNQNLILHQEQLEKQIYQIRIQNEQLKQQIDNLTKELQMTTNNSTVNKNSNRNSLEFFQQHEEITQPNKIVSLEEQMNKINETRRNDIRSRAQSRFEDDQILKRIHLQQDLKVSNKKIEQLELKIAEMNENFIDEKRSLQQSMNKILQNQKIYKNTHQSYTFRIDELNKIEQTNKYTIKKLNDDLLEQRTQSYKIKTLKEKIEKQFAQLSKQNQQRIKKLDKYRQKNETLTSQNNKLILQVKKQQQEKLTHMKNLKQLQSKSLSSQKINTQNQNALKQKYDINLKQIQRLHSLVSSYQQKQRNFTDQIKTLKNTIQDQNKSIQDLKIQINNTNNKISSLEFDLKNQKGKLTQELKKQELMQITLKQYKQKVEQLKKNNSVQKQSIFRIPSLKDLKQITNDNDEIENNIFLDLQKKQYEIADLKNKVSDLEFQINRMNDTFTKEKDYMTSQCQGYIKQIVSMKLKVAQTEMNAEQKIYKYNLMKKKYDEMITVKKDVKGLSAHIK